MLNFSPDVRVSKRIAHRNVNRISSGGKSHMSLAVSVIIVTLPRRRRRLSILEVKELTHAGDSYGFMSRSG
jgi:hypothetical protein